MMSFADYAQLFKTLCLGRWKVDLLNAVTARGLE
jgi:hypothetical protein